MPTRPDQRKQSTRDWIVDDIAFHIESLIIAIPLCIAVAIAATVFDMSFGNAVLVGLAIAIVIRLLLEAWRFVRRNGSRTAEPRHIRDDL